MKSVSVCVLFLVNRRARFLLPPSLAAPLSHLPIPFPTPSEIHDGPAENNYNDTQPWNYTAVVEGFKGHSNAKLLTARATTEAELKAAIAAAVAAPDHLAFIEFVIDRDDCSRELLEWGSRVAATNGRAPDPR